MRYNIHSKVRKDIRGDTGDAVRGSRGQNSELWLKFLLTNKKG